MVSRGAPSRRSGTHVRRTRVRRETPRLRSVQIVAGTLMAVCLVGLVGISMAPAFAGRILEVHGTTFTSESIVRKIVGMDGAPNLFRLEADEAAAQLARLPAVKSVSVRVRLPSTVIVNIVERVPRLVWVIGEEHFVVDEEGLLFGRVDSAGNPIVSDAGPLPTPAPASLATNVPSDVPSGSLDADASPTASPTAKPTPTLKPTPTATPKPTSTPTKNPKATPTKPGAKATPSPVPTPAGSPTPTPNPSVVPSLEPAPTADPEAASGTQALGLGLVYDRRALDANLGLGGMVDPTNLDAGYRLAGLTPTDLGSKASAVIVILDDQHGFTVSSIPTGWVAQFGFYAPVVRKVTVIPEQVRVLRSMLGQFGEAKVFWVFLVSDISADHLSTYVPR